MPIFRVSLVYFLLASQALAGGQIRRPPSAPSVALVPTVAPESPASPALPTTPTTSAPPASPAATAAHKPCEGYRYVYADLEGVKNDMVSLFGCKQVGTDKVPAECEIVAKVNTKLIKEGEEKIIQELKSFGKGVAAGTACYLAVHGFTATSGLWFGMGWTKTAAVALWTGVINTAYSILNHRAVVKAVEKETQDGYRKLGQYPIGIKADPGFDSSICMEVRHVGEASFRTGVKVGLQEALHIVSLRSLMDADQETINRIPRGPERDAAYKEFDRNLKNTLAMEKEAAELTGRALVKAYTYVMDDGPLSIPVGTSAKEADVAPNSCVPMAKIQKLVDDARVLLPEAKKFLKSRRKVAAEVDAETGSEPPPEAASTPAAVPAASPAKSPWGTLDPNSFSAE